MSDNRTLIEAFRALVKSNEGELPIACNVVAGSVDLVKLTCTCEPIDESGTIYNVKLNADASKSFLLEPEDNSVVVVVMTSETTGFISMVSKVKNIYLKGDTFGGLIKIDDLKLQWDANIGAIKAACVAAFTALSTLDGSASLNAFNGLSSSIQNLNKTTLENKNVQHGSI